MKNFIKMQISQKLKPLLVKDECDICNSTESLKLHYIVFFNEIFEKCHQDLNIKIKENKEDYSEIEINNILNYMLGAYVRSKHLTLCKECLKREYKNKNFHGIAISNSTAFQTYLIKDKLRKDAEHKKRIQNILIPYLDSHIGISLLQNKDRTELIKNINYKRNGKLIKKIENLNFYLEQNNIPYRIVKFSTSKTIDGKQKRYPNAWRIEKI